MELGVFFSNCDGNIDKREKNFLDDYIEKMVASGQIHKNELEEIKNSINKTPDIEYLIRET